VSKSRGRSKKKRPASASHRLDPAIAAAQELAAQLDEFDFVEVRGLQPIEKDKEKDGKKDEVADDRVRLAIRIDEEEESSWFSLIKFALKEERRQKKNEWSAHICRQFMLHPDDPNKLGYLWNVIIRADNIERAVSDVCRIIDVASNAVIMGEEEPARRRPGRVPTPSRGRQKALNHARRWRAPESTIRGGNKPGQELREYDLGANHVVPEVGLMAPAGKRKGAHLIGGG